MLIPCMLGFEFILKIGGSRPKAYRNMDKEHPCLTDLLILKVDVKVPLTKILDSISVYKILNHFIKLSGKLNFLSTIFKKLCSILSKAFS